MAAYNNDVRSYFASIEKNKKSVSNSLFDLIQLSPFQLEHNLSSLDEESMLKLSQFFSRQYMLYASFNMKLTRKAVFLLRKNGHSNEVQDLVKDRRLYSLHLFKDTIAILNECFLDLGGLEEEIEEKSQKLIEFLPKIRFLIWLEISILKVDSEYADELVSLCNNIINFVDLFLPKLHKNAQNINVAILGKVTSAIECLLKACLVTRIIVNNHKQEMLLRDDHFLVDEDQRLKSCFNQLNLIKDKVFKAEISGVSPEISDPKVEYKLSFEDISHFEAKGLVKNYIKYHLEMCRYLFKMYQYVDESCRLKIPEKTSLESNPSTVELQSKIILDELKVEGKLIPLDIFEACWLAYKKNGGKRLSSELVRLSGFSQDNAYQNLYVGGKRSMNPASLPLIFNPLPPGDILGGLMSPYPAGYGSMWGAAPHAPAVRQGIAAAYLPPPPGAGLQMDLVPNK
ncbi:MAG: hypothetical protein K0R12_1014 [Gammaproteobacteria bacterium]|jgi:hypothetical protein|nr:hypothetical protein [Gammaproteobacteria bacterium]